MMRYQTTRFIDDRDALESRIDGLYLTIGVRLEDSREWEKVLGKFRTVSGREDEVGVVLTSWSTVCGSDGRRLSRSSVPESYYTDVGIEFQD